MRVLSVNDYTFPTFTKAMENVVLLKLFLRSPSLICTIKNVITVFYLRKFAHRAFAILRILDNSLFDVLFIKELKNTNLPNQYYKTYNSISVFFQVSDETVSATGRVLSFRVKWSKIVFHRIRIPISQNTSFDYFDVYRKMPSFLIINRTYYIGWQKVMRI